MSASLSASVTLRAGLPFSRAVSSFFNASNGQNVKLGYGRATREEVLSAEQAEYDRGIHIDETVPIGQGLFRSGNVEADHRDI